MSGSHTPGPWAADYDGGETFDICSERLVVAQVWRGCPANAHLISAAPDLLEALKWLVKAYEVHSDHAYCALNPDRQAVDAAEAAILKAQPTKGVENV